MEEEPLPWIKQIPDAEANAFYDSVAREMIAVDETTAHRLMKLKMFHSQFVGLIDTPDKAIDHIQRCLEQGITIGGRQDYEPKRKPLPFGMTAEQVATLEQKRAYMVEEARKAWRTSVQQKKAAMKEWDAYVRNLHDRFIALRDMSVSQFEKIASKGD